MKTRDIFESDFAIKLARNMADRQHNVSPANTFSRLLLFGAIGIGVFVIGASSLFLNLSTLVSDPNTKMFLSFTSFVAALMLLATIGASLIFLWDAFIGEYIQKLALLGQQADRTEDFFKAAPMDEGFDIPLVPVAASSPVLPARAEPAADFGLSLKVEDREFVLRDGISTHILDKQLEELRAVVPTETWNQLNFDETLRFFQGLPQTATVGGTFGPGEQVVIARVLSLLSDPLIVQRFDLAEPIAQMLSTLPRTIVADSENDSLKDDVPAAM